MPDGNAFIRAHCGQDVRYVGYIGNSPATCPIGSGWEVRPCFPFVALPVGARDGAPSRGAQNVASGPAASGGTQLPKRAAMAVVVAVILGKSFAQSMPYPLPTNGADGIRASGTRCAYNGLSSVEFSNRGN